MKGSGLFILSTVLIAAILISYLESLKEAQHSISGICGSEAKYAKLTTLHNAIQRSYEKTDHLHLSAWKLAVQTTLAEEYDATIIINESKVTIISNELNAVGEFYLR